MDTYIICELPNLPPGHKLRSQRISLGSVDASSAPVVPINTNVVLPNLGVRCREAISLHLRRSPSNGPEILSAFYNGCSLGVGEFSQSQNDPDDHEELSYKAPVGHHYG